MVGDNVADSWTSHFRRRLAVFAWTEIGDVVHPYYRVKLDHDQYENEIPNKYSL